MVTLRKKPHPDAVRILCKRVILNEFEKELSTKFIEEYNRFYVNGRFKFIDSYFENSLQKMANLFNRTLYNNIMIFIECIGMSFYLFSSTKLFNIEELYNFLLVNPTPSDTIRESLDLMLLKNSDNIKNDDELKYYIYMCMILESTILVDSVKFSYMFISSVREVKDINLNSCLVTFKSNISYGDFEEYLLNSEYTKIIRVYERNVNHEEIEQHDEAEQHDEEFTQIDLNHLFIKIYDVNYNSRTLRSRNNRQEISVKFIYK